MLASIGDWYLLGVNLGLGSHRLNQIEMDYPGESSRRMVEMLNHWLRHSENPTWEAIADALSQMTQHIAALEVERKYCSSSSAIGM